MCDEDMGITVFLVSIFLAGLVLGLGIGITSKPQEPKSTFADYQTLLSIEGIHVVDKELAATDYKEVSFTLFLTLLKTANATECYYDAGARVIINFRTEKLWYLYDGIYYEVRR